MTEQEAMDDLKQYDDCAGLFVNVKHDTCIMAIKALEEQIKIKMLGKSYIIPRHGVWGVNGVDIHKAIEKQIPKQVKLYIGQDMQCPVCNKRLRGYEGMKICYCKFCGQALER